MFSTFPFSHAEYDDVITTMITTMMTTMKAKHEQTAKARFNNMFASPGWTKQAGCYRVTV